MTTPSNSEVENVLPVQAYFNIDGSFNTFIGQGHPFVISATESIGVIDTLVNGTFYPTFSPVSSGQITSIDVTSTKLTWNPSTGVFSAPTFTGALNGTASNTANITGGTASNLVYQITAGQTGFIANGTSGQFLRSNGSSAPSWQTVATSVTIADETTSSSTFYPLFYSATSGSTNTVDTSSTKLQYIPSSGTLISTVFSGSGASLTNIPNSALTNSSFTLGSTSISLGNTVTTIAGLSSVTSTTFVGALTGNASTATTATNATNTAITDNTSSSATWYPTIVSNSTGNLPQTTSSSKLSFVPNTGVLSATSFTGAGTGLTGTASSLSIGGTATTATNLAGGLAGYLPYQTAINTTTFLAPGTNGYVLTLSGGLPTWAASSGGVTTFSAGTTGLTPSSATSGAITLAGTLAIANGGTNATATPTAGTVAYGTGTAYAFTAAGTAGQVLQSNGSSAPSWVTSSSGFTWQSVQTANFTAVAGNGYPVNTTSGAITVTLPASPTAGQLITITDYAGTANTNAITVNPNGNKIQSSTSNFSITIARQSINFVYIDSTQGWLVYAAQSARQYLASYLVVAGGGGGGQNSAGGGGGGGLISNTVNLLAGTAYTVTVGAGGVGGSVVVATVNTVPTNGSNSVFSIFTAIGGGAGANSGGNGSSGGSGGGAGSTSGATAGSGTSGQGTAGGVGMSDFATYGVGGGGGGSSSAGSNASGGNGGAGGAGVSSSITGSALNYAGGGGGSGDSRGTHTAGAGGTGGGGAGSNTLTAATAGTVNTGGGGGAGPFVSVAGGTGGAGGSGVVILSVLTSDYSGATTGSPTVTTSGSNTIIKFTSSGSYTA